MKRCYREIIERFAEHPKWFTEGGFPRWCEFHPNEVDDIYAREVALVRIACQSCGHLFRVAFSWYYLETRRNGELMPPLSERLKSLHYGDPPNIECCAAGPTMTSDSRRILEFWKVSDETRDWVRVTENEIDLEE